MDAPVVEMVLKANVSKEHAGVSATLINKWHDSVYIDKRFISQGKYLMSDWGNLSCSGVKIRYYGLRYNAGSGFFIKIKPGEELAGSKINLAEDYSFPAQGYCKFNVEFWVSTEPVVNDDLTGTFFMSSNAIEFHADGMNFDKIFLKRHREIN